MKLVFSILALGASLWARQPLVAVSELTPRGVTKNDAAIIADRLRSEMVETGRLRVLERTEMDKILREQSFQKSGACDTAECAVEIGRLLAVDRIVVGSVGRIGGVYTIGVRLLDVGTGEILFSANQDQDGGLERLLVKAVPELASRLVEGTTQADVAERRQKRGVGDLQVTLAAPDARLFLDGRPVSGKSPFFFERLEAGPHRLEARTRVLFGTLQVQLEPDDLQKVVVPMDTGKGSLKVLTEPQGATVYLDGDRIGESPLKKADAKVGRHTVRIRKDGFLDTAFQVDIAMDSMSNARVGLEPSGILNLQSNALIFPKMWRGQDTVFRSGAGMIQLRPGRWRLSPCPQRNWISRDTTFEIRAGDTTGVKLDLLPYYATLKVRADREAKVLLDDRDIGTAPVEYGSTEPGTHVLKVLLGDSVVRREFAAVSGQILSFQFSREGGRPSALLRLRSPNPGKVYLDGLQEGVFSPTTGIGWKTWDSDSLLPGNHRLRVVSPGLLDWDSVLVLGPGQILSREVRQDLDPRLGTPPGFDRPASIRPAVRVIGGIGTLVSLGVMAYWSHKLDVAKEKGRSNEITDARTNTALGGVSASCFAVMFVLSLDAFAGN